jgi:hypothetical protein
LAINLGVERISKERRVRSGKRIRGRGGGGYEKTQKGGKRGGEKMKGEEHGQNMGNTGDLRGTLRRVEGRPIADW